MTDVAAPVWQHAVETAAGCPVAARRGALGKEIPVLKMNNLCEVLAGQELDPAVGIKVARLSGDESFSLFGAEIAAGTKLSAHYHREGIEIYYILSGTGRMSLGECMEGDTVMNALFGCPAGHLTTDRTIIGGPR